MTVIGIALGLSLLIAAAYIAFACFIAVQLMTFGEWQP